MIKQLKINPIKHKIPIGGINSMNTFSKGVANVTLYSHTNSFRITLSFLVVSDIIDRTPSEAFSRELIKIPKNIKLADPNFHLPQAIDILIGSAPTLSLLSVGRLNLSQLNYQLYLQKTLLGWVASGCSTSSPTIESHSCHLITLEEQIDKFWRLEEIVPEKPKSTEDIECENLFTTTTTRNEDGRYVVRLPFRTGERHSLGDSYTVAMKRFLSLERKFAANPDLQISYSKVMQEYIDLGHMSLIDSPDIEGYYFPHHPVYKLSSATTKLRVVFDGSSKSSSGKSLNELLMIGPTIQEKIFIQLIKFRYHKFVLTADIEKMYRQVLLHKDDRLYHRILWRIDGKIHTFQLNTLTFGVSSSPYLAIRTIHKLADDEAYRFPTASKVLKEDLYVDDLLTGADTLDDARSLRDQIIQLLDLGKFNIRQWASNDHRLLNDLSDENLNPNFTLDKDNPLKTLGVYWDAKNDYIRYSVKPITCPSRVTKRNVVSEIAKIYDPLGLLSPVILHAKAIMQSLWRSRVDWDESIPVHIHTTWCNFIDELPSLNNISFDRRMISDNCTQVQIHGFCDASKIGYGACLYIRSTFIQEGITKVESRLICAKSRVAPLKITDDSRIPRLELCGALLLVRLYEEASQAFNFTPERVVFWCDSTIVLHWIDTQAHLLKTYVANRVIEIQQKSVGKYWRHVRSPDNPADPLSRGQSPKNFLKNERWATGPTWLCLNKKEWPIGPWTIQTPIECKPNVCLLTNVNKKGASSNQEIGLRWEHCTSYPNAVAIVALLLRRTREHNINTGPISQSERFTAEIKLIKSIQQLYLTSIIREIEVTGTTKDSKTSVLSPFIDDDGLLRVGGRLRKSDLPFEQKHPILLPPRNRITDLLIEHVHKRKLHAGIQGTLHAIRKKYWITDGKNQIRRIVHKCQQCYRFNAKVIDYKMSDLPRDRLIPATTFEKVGIDYCGPFFVKEKKFRNRVLVKCYVCVFICMVVKAVHLEVVSDMTTQGFLGALRRFIARRGTPKHIFSDNGTNFIGANNQLKELYDLFKTDEHKDEINKFAAGVYPDPITWHFIPPLAPHQGGLWESTVKLFKHHLKRVVGESVFTYEQFETFTIEIEGVLNSRPLTPLSSDPNDLSALTPAHILIGKLIGKIPEPDVDLRTTPTNRLSVWQHITKIRQDFWHRWRLEYLNELQQRQKWIVDRPNLEVNTIVLIKDKNVPCLQWPMGRVIAVHPGDDGVVRTATIRTANGELKRSAKLLCPLPSDYQPIQASEPN